MAALSTADNNDSDSGRGMSGRLLDGLEVVIPPLVAAAILSPLILIESLIAAFVETGRGLLLPGVLLVVLTLWMARGLRKPIEEPQQ